MNIHEFQVILISGQESTPPTTTSTATLKHISTTPLNELQDFETSNDGERLYHFDMILRLNIPKLNNDYELEINAYIYVSTQ